MESRKVIAKALVVGAKIRWIDGNFTEVKIVERIGGVILAGIRIMVSDGSTIVIPDQAKIEVAYEFPTYPAGTSINDVTTIDRGQKLHFKCSEHEWCQFVSKDPMVSNWFAANIETVELGECHHDDSAPKKWVLASEYKPTRND